MPFDQTQMDTLISATHSATDGIENPELLEQAIAPLSLPLSDAIQILKRNRHLTPQSGSHEINIPHGVMSAWSNLLALPSITSEMKLPTVLSEHPNFNPIYVAEMQRFEESLPSTLSEAAREQLLRLRELYLGMTPKMEYSYGGSPFYFRIGNIPLHLDKLGSAIPTQSEIQTAVERLVAREVDLLREHNEKHKETEKKSAAELDKQRAELKEKEKQLDAELRKQKAKEYIRSTFPSIKWIERNINGKDFLVSDPDESKSAAESKNPQAQDYSANQKAYSYISRDQVSFRIAIDLSLIENTAPKQKQIASATSAYSFHTSATSSSTSTTSPTTETKAPAKSAVEVKQVAPPSALAASGSRDFSSMTVEEQLEILGRGFSTFCGVTLTNTPENLTVFNSRFHTGTQYPRSSHVTIPSGRLAPLKFNILAERLGPNIIKIIEGNKEKIKAAGNKIENYRNYTVEISNPKENIPKIIKAFNELANQGTSLLQHDASWTMIVDTSVKKELKQFLGDHGLLSSQLAEHTRPRPPV